MAQLDRSSFQDHLDALRNANDGWAISVYKDGSWKLWRTLDAKYAEKDDGWLVTLPGSVIDIDRAALAATGHPMQPYSPR